MNMNDALKARRSLVSLLRQPHKWPPEFVYDWGNSYPNINLGYTSGCAIALAEVSEIFSDLSELGLSYDERDPIFFDAHNDGTIHVVIANRLEETIPIHLELL